MNKTLQFHTLAKLLVYVCVTLSCKSEPERTLVISKLKSASKLSTVEYIVTKVISAKDKNWFARDAYFFAETEASIKAGIDLDKLREEDVKVNGRRISIKLPPVEILNFSYPAEGFKVINAYTDESAIFKWNSIDIETKDDLFRQGEADIRSSLKDLGIINAARDNIETPDKQLLKDLSEFLEKNK